MHGGSRGRKRQAWTSCRSGHAHAAPATGQAAELIVVGACMRCMREAQHAYRNTGTHWCHWVTAQFYRAAF
jgi:hypothetical protein